LIIQNEPRRISLDIKIENGEVFLSGTLYYLGQFITITKDDLRSGNKIVSGTIFEDSYGAIQL
jgi:hypothetical protein